MIHCCFRKGSFNPDLARALYAPMDQIHPSYHATADCDNNDDNGGYARDADE